MNKNQIQKYEDVLDEKKRLEQLLALQKEQISTNWIEMKKEFEPVNNVVSFFSKLTTRDKSNPLVNMGINVAGDIVLRKILLARFGWATRLVIPFLLKNYSSNIIADKGKSFVHKVKHWLTNRRNGKSGSDYEQF